ncbi:uncharacterized protein [Miscanthus floridulus]|uniref:uncharacterized protein n=1 Tax=Miscanthus floridulus TaxID=154761 RepID=UPI00345B3D48
MGRGLFLPAAIFGPVACFATVVTAVAAWWPPATGVPGARVLAIAAIPRRGSFAAASASAPSALSVAAGARVATGALLLTTSLATSFPVLLTEHQAPHGVRDLLGLDALLEHAQPPNRFLDGDLVQVEEHLEGDSGLREPVRDDLQQLLHYLCVCDVVAEGAKIGGERGDADAELIDGLPLLEGESAEFPAELLRTGVVRTFVADPQVLDRVPHLLHGALPGESTPELGRHRAQESCHRLSVVVILVFVGVVGDAVVDSVPDTEDLEIHLHDQGPFRIISPGQHRPRDVRGRPLDDALDDS